MPPKKTTARRQRTTFKVVLRSPFRPDWPAISPSVSNSIVQRLASIFQKKPRSELRSFFRIGFNEVQRSLEREELTAILVSKDPLPAALVDHLPLSCSVKNVVLARVMLQNSALGAVFGVRSAMVVGLTKSCGEDEGLAALSSFLTENVPKIQIERVPIPEVSDEIRKTEDWKSKEERLERRKIEQQQKRNANKGNVFKKRTERPRKMDIADLKIEKVEKQQQQQKKKKKSNSDDDAVAAAVVDAMVDDEDGLDRVQAKKMKK